MERYLISKKLLTLIRSNLKIFISIALIASMGMITLIALLSSYQTLTTSLVDFRLNYGFPDITINSSLLTKDASLIDTIKDLDGVDNVETRMVADMQLTRPDGRGLTGRMMSYHEGDLFNTLNVMESGRQGEGIALSVEHYFAQVNHIKVGDPLTITINGTKYDAYVAQIVSVFEAASINRNAYISYDTMDFGYVYLANEDLQKLLESPVNMTNQIFVSVQDDSDSDSVIAEIKNLDAPEIRSYNTYEDSPQKTALDNSIVPLRALSLAIPPLLYLITLLITYLFIYQVIQEQRHEIGVLRALGFSAGQIRGLYFAFSLCISLISAIVGIPTGIFLTRYVSATYQSAFGIPVLHYIYDFKVMILALVITTLIGLLGTHISSKAILKISPAEAMRDKSTQQASVPGAQKLVASLNSVAKVAISSSLRNKRRVFISLLSVILTSFLILVSLSYSFSVRDIIDHTFNERYLYDAQIFFSDETDQIGISNRLSSFSQINELEAVGMKSDTISFGDNEEDVLICGVPQENSMIQVFDANRQILAVPEKGLILEEFTANKLGVKQGDVVIINGTEVEVASISKENINKVQYCSLDEFESLYGSASINSAIVEMKNPADENGFYEAVSDSDNFSYLSFSSIQKQSLDNTFAFTNAGVYTLILCAFIVGLLIIYNMSLISIEERIRDYAVMRVLGISPGAIALGTYTEILIQFFIAISIGLSAGNVFSGIMLSSMSSDTITYFNANSFEVFALIALVVFAFMSFGHVLAVTRIYKLDLIESLKTHD